MNTLLTHSFQCLLNPKKFLKFDNIITVLSLVTAIIVAVVGENVGQLRGIYHSLLKKTFYSLLFLEITKPDWILQVLSVLLLFVWMELMSLLGKLPALGYYAIMFTTVLKNVLKVCIGVS